MYATTRLVQHISLKMVGRNDKRSMGTASCQCKTWTPRKYTLNTCSIYISLLQVEDNVCYNTFDQAYLIEDGGEKDNNQQEPGYPCKTWKSFA